MNVIVPRIDFGGVTLGGIVFAASLLAQALFKPFADSYFKRLGANLADKQDIDNVLQKVGKVTTTTETIKSEISGDLWHKQWVLTQKRDAYVKLIDAMETIRVMRGHVRRSTEASLAENRHLLAEAIVEFRRARALARLLVRPDAIVAIRPVLQAVDPKLSAEPDFAKSQDAIRVARDSFVDIAKQDLRIDTQTLGADRADSPIH